MTVSYEIIVKTPIDELLNEYLETRQEVLAEFDNLNLSNIFNIIVKKAGCYTLEEILIWTSEAENLSESTVKNILNGKAKNPKVMTVLWLCVCFNPSYDDIVRLFYCTNHNLDTLCGDYEIVLKIIRYIPFLGEDYLERCESVRNILSKYKKNKTKASIN